MLPSVAQTVKLTVDLKTAMQSSALFYREVKSGALSQTYR